jgi:hypothetical protein
MKRHGMYRPTYTIRGPYSREAKGRWIGFVLGVAGTVFILTAVARHVFK